MAVARPKPGHVPGGSLRSLTRPSRAYPVHLLYTKGVGEQVRGNDVLEGWIGVKEGAHLTGYSVGHVKYLARNGKVLARRVGLVHVINRDSLLAYKHEMDRLGKKKHNPWGKGK